MNGGKQGDKPVDEDKKWNSLISINIKVYYIMLFLWHIIAHLLIKKRMSFYIYQTVGHKLAYFYVWILKINL